MAMAPTAEGDNPLRRMIGLQEPFSPEKLRGLYQSRADYLKRFDREINHLVAQRCSRLRMAKRLRQTRRRFRNSNVRGDQELISAS
jgi:hypothetical protein